MSAMAPVVPERDRRRLVSTFGLLASDQDGEVVAAARAAMRLLKPYGVTPAELIRIALEPKPKPAADPFSGFPKTEPIHEHQRLARMCLVVGAELLNTWEKEFLTSVADQRTLSAKQKEKLQAIKAKIERRGK